MRCAKRISLLNEQLALLQEELKKAEKSQEGWFNWFAASNKEVQNLKDNIQDVQDAIDDATQELEDYMGGWVTENTIAEAIAEGFASGKTSSG